MNISVDKQSFSQKFVRYLELVGISKRYAHKLWLIICCWSFQLEGYAQNRQLLDKVVAIVGDRPILHSTIEEKVNRGPLVLVSSFPSNDSAPSSEKALNDAINLELVMQKSDELKIEIEEEKIDQQIANLTKYNNITLEQLKDFVASQGKSFVDYREDLRRQMVFMRFKGRELVPKIKVTDKDIQAFYLKKSGDVSDNVQVVVQHILISIPTDAPISVVEQKQKTVDLVYQKLVDGLPFEEAVRIYSDHGGAQQGNSTITMKQSDFPNELESAVAKLEPGTFTTPIRTESGFQMIFLQNRLFQANSNYLEKKPELERQLRDQQLEEVTKSWMETARKRTKVRVLSELN